MYSQQDIKFDKLKDLPSLREGWVRLVHRCVSKDGSVESIKQRGLIFNGIVAKDPWGGAYDTVTSMASVYDEKGFWQSMEKDDFYCYDNAGGADTKLVFDMPMDEFAILQRYGGWVKGKIDSKYLVGCIQNVNGANKKLSMDPKEVRIAAYYSMKNPPSQTEPNNMESLILTMCRHLTTKEEIMKQREKIMEGVRREKENVMYAFKEKEKKIIKDLETTKQDVELQKPLKTNISTIRQSTFCNDR